MIYWNSKLHTLITNYQSLNYQSNDRSNRSQVFSKKAVTKCFAKFKGKHLSQNLFSITLLPHILPGILFKKRLWLRCSEVTFTKFFTTPFLTENIRATARMIIKFLNGFIFHRLSNLIMFLILSAPTPQNLPLALKGFITLESSYKIFS